VNLIVGYLDVVLTLLNHHANPNMADVEGWTALHLASFWGHLEILEPLVIFNASLDAVNQHGETPLDVSDDPKIRDKLEG